MCLSRNRWRHVTRLQLHVYVSKQRSKKARPESVNYKKRTDLWLCVCAITTLVALSGCATVKAPEVGAQFREYPELAERPREELLLPSEPVIQYNDDGTVWMTEEQFKEFEIFVETAYTIQQVASSRADELLAREAEIRYLVRAGQLTEMHAEVIAQMYTNEVQECRLIRIGAYGVAGLSFLILGVGAL